MRVFVTGATGVLGRRVVALLAADGHEVTAVARGKAAQVRSAGATPVEVDLFDAGGVKTVVEGHDAVLDLATRIPPSARMALRWAWRENDRLRSVASKHAADAAIAANARYVRESIGFLYADGGEQWLDENAPLAPLAPTRSALDAEAAAQRVTAAGGAGVVLRFGQFYGPDSIHTREQVAAARRGLAMLLGDLEAFDSWVRLDDAASAAVAALDAPPGVYNVADDEPVRRRELVAILEELVGRRLKTPPKLVGRIGGARAVARSRRLDTSRLRGVTGWAPTWPSVREGVPAVLAAMEEREGA